MLKSETDKKSRIFDSGDFIGDIINRSIAVRSKSGTTPICSHFQRRLKSSPDLVPHNSVEDLSQTMAAKVHKLGVGPTDVLSKGATIQCVNCGNMARNLAYLENYIKTNGSKNSSCSTCSTALSFLEYLNKNIETVFNNINSAGMHVLEQQSVAAPKFISEANSTSLNKPKLKKILKGRRTPKTASELSKPKGMASQITSITSTGKTVSKGLKGLKKIKPKIKNKTSQMDEGVAKGTKSKVKTVRKRTTKLATKSEQSNPHK